MNKIRQLVGEVTAGQLRYVDSLVSDKFAAFMPLGGACHYALTPEHTHPSYMFVLCFDERTVVRFGNLDIRSRPGRFMAISPGIPHTELPSDLPPRYIALCIEKGFFEEQLSLYPQGGGAKLFKGELYVVPQGFKQLVRKFMIEAENGIPGSRSVCNAFGVEICHAIIRTVLGVSTSPARISSRIEVDEAVEFMHSHMAEKITLDTLAGAARMSSTNFKRVFRQETGVSPMNYLLGLRLEKAKKMLLAGDKSVTEIALECGFLSPSYFSERFHRSLGISPTAYRNGLISKRNGPMDKAPAAGPVR